MLIFSQILHLVSHSRERNEANCLNCDTQVVGRFCHVCGQENIEPRESFVGLVTHFFNDITHFDGKFFTTVGKLVRKPGLLPVDYMNGRRARYLHPIRMYLFTSALFFLVFYSYTYDSIFNVKSIGSPPPVAMADPYTLELNVLNKKYPSIAAYDSIQRTLPAAEKHNWVERKLVRRSITMGNRYNNNVEGFLKDLSYGLLHSLPSLLFVSLPLFALLLKMLYARRRFVYADHAIFLVFLYIFLFLLFITFIALDSVFSVFNKDVGSMLLFGAIVYAIIYFGLSMKRFYSQGWGKTTLKFLTFNLLAFFIVLVLFIVFLLLTFFKV